MPDWANVPGIRLVPRMPSTGPTAPYRPDGSYGLSLRLGWAPSRPSLPICSRPTARPMLASPALIAIAATRNAVAPVAHALVTL